MIEFLDTNVLINLIRKNLPLPAYAAISVVVAGELKAFAVKRQWGYQKRLALEKILGETPIFGIELGLTDVYATIDAYSQDKLTTDPLPTGLSSRNMGKNDMWIAATALFYDAELQTSGNDFDHLPAIGLRLRKIETTV